MRVNLQHFFREATLRIGSSLDVGAFLHASFMYIREFIPAEQIALVYFDSEYALPQFHAEKGNLVLLAAASCDGSTLYNKNVPLLPEVSELIKRLGDQRILLVRRSADHPPAAPWLDAGLLHDDDSLLILRLFIEHQNIGTVTLIANKPGVFTQEHADLFSALQEPFALALSNSVRYKKLLDLKEFLAEDNRFLRRELLHAIGDDIIGADFGLKGVMDMVHHVAPQSSPVLLLGETGTGKEVIASAIHTLSDRNRGPFIKVNCGAIPETIVDSELFGHEKGAFTGAISRKRGRFERAHGGTIFLDEVGELQPDAQVRLLRVLQEKELERVGGTEPLRVNIRVIAATHRDLTAMVKEGTFREDLFFRLNVFPITIPPLRERKSDIPSLIQHVIQKKSREMGHKNVPSLAPGVSERLKAYSWPGNVRELQNAVERALILNKGEPLTFSDIYDPVPQTPYSGHAPAGEEPPGSPAEEELALDAVMSQHIRRVLEMTDGQVEGKGGAAGLLQINPSTLRKRMRKLGIPFGQKAKRNKID